VQLTISSYLIGFAVGQTIYGPVSDRSRPPAGAVWRAALYVARRRSSAPPRRRSTADRGTLPCRAIGGSGSIVLARAIVRDLYSGVRAARELSLMGSISAFAPIVAPMIGGVFQTAFGWRASFIFMAAPRDRHGARGAIVAGDAAPAFRSADLVLVSMVMRRILSLGAAAPRLCRLSRHHYRITYAGLFAWVSGASVVLQGIYGLSAVTFGFTFALGAAGYMLGATIVAARLVVRLGLDRTMGIGVMVIAAGGLALAAVVVAAGIPGVWLVVAMALYLAGLGLAMPQAMAGALTPFPDRAGTAASLMGLVQQAVAADRRRRDRRISRPLRVAGYRRCRRDGLPHLPSLGAHASLARARALNVSAGMPQF
jgi:DHA1 family bicyclomycin/chloramphenicol resistance-like MFS transporter